MATANGNYTQSGEDFTIPDSTSEKWNTTEWVIQALTALKNHQHRAGRGLGVGRLDTATTPASAGEVQVTGDLFTYWGASAAAVKTAVNTDSSQTLANKTLTTPTVNGYKLALATKVAADSPVTVAATNAVLLCNCASGAITLNLPAASGNSGLTLWIKKTDSSVNAVTIDGNASETIDGALTLALSLQYQAYTIACDGSNWHIL